MKKINITLLTLLILSGCSEEPEEPKEPTELESCITSLTGNIEFNYQEKHNKFMEENLVIGAESKEFEEKFGAFIDNELTDFENEVIGCAIEVSLEYDLAHGQIDPNNQIQVLQWIKRYESNIELCNERISSEVVEVATKSCNLRGIY